MSDQEKEINLLEVFSKGFNFIKNSIIGFLLFLRRNLTFLIIFILLGGIGGFVHFKFSKPLFVADIIVSSNYLSNNLCLELIADLQNYVNDNTPEMLSEKLSIEMDVAKKIAGFKYENFDELLSKKYKDKDTIALNVPFRIKVLATDNTIYEKLRPAIMNYFEKNPYVIEQKNIRLSNTQAIIYKIRREQIELDTLKKVISNHLVPRGTSTGFVFGQPLDPLNVYKEGMTLYKEELTDSADVVLYSENLHLIRDFDVREKPYRPKLTLSLAFGTLIGAIIGILIALFNGMRKK